MFKKILKRIIRYYTIIFALRINGHRHLKRGLENRIWYHVQYRGLTNRAAMEEFIDALVAEMKHTDEPEETFARYPLSVNS